MKKFFRCPNFEKLDDPADWEWSFEEIPDDHCVDHNDVIVKVISVKNKITYSVVNNDWEMIAKKAKIEVCTYIMERIAEASYDQIP